MNDPGKRESLKRISAVTDGISAGCRAHVAVDRGCLIRFQLHKLLHQENRLGAMSAKAELLLYRIVGYFLPLPVDFLVARISPVEVDLAQIMEKRRDRNALFRQFQLIPCYSPAL